jgi:adenylate kinase
MTLYAITGTPGTGKTSLSAELRSRGYDVIDMNSHIREHGLLGELDAPRDTHEVDLDLLNDSLEPYRADDEIHLMDSHLSHFMDCRCIIVLRCDPDILAERLRARGYGEAKVRENVQSEILDVILCEATESDIPVYEVDCSDRPVSAGADDVEGILKGRTDDYLPGRFDWTEAMDRWF